MDDYYEVLQVSPNADRAVIEAAYRRLSRINHPDVNPSPDAGERQRQLNRAFHVLSNSETRASYDRLTARSSANRPHHERPTHNASAAPPDSLRTSSARHWWRWPLVLPAALLGAAVAGVAVHVFLVFAISSNGLLNALELSDTTIMRIENPLWAALGAYAFVTLGTRTAPCAKSVVALVLGGLALVCLTGVFVFVVTYAATSDEVVVDWNWPWSALIAGSVIAGGIVGTAAGVFETFDRRT